MAEVGKTHINRHLLVVDARELVVNLAFLLGKSGEILLNNTMLLLKVPMVEREPARGSALRAEGKQARRT